MIFVTVGAQMPFERLIAGVDAWAAQRGRDDVFAQIGPTDAAPRRIAWERFLDPPEFRRRLIESEAIVAHAGMGTILTALEHAKPILVMPRLGRLRETRNDHQVATAERFLQMGRVAVAMDETELPDALDNLLTTPAGERISPWASPALLETIRRFIRGEAVSPQTPSAPVGDRRRPEPQRKTS